MIVLTRLLVAVNVIAYVWEAASSGDLNNPLGGPHAAGSIVASGILYGPAVDAGQWWRIVTAAFLHGSLSHILFNMLALWQVGQVVEFLYGPVRMGAIYALALAGGAEAVLHFNYATPTLGASGAIFGLFGAMLAAGLRLGQRGRQLVRQTTPIIVINLIFTFLFPGISVAGHIGGLISGVLAGLVLFNVMPPRRRDVRSEEAVAVAEVDPVPTYEHEPAPKSPGSPA